MNSLKSETSMKKKGIGVFDSGLGGLTVVKELMKELPLEQIIYLGDTARTPYGTKTKETIIRFSIENATFLMKNDVKLIVVACNTASALALSSMKKIFNIDVIGVIDAGARAAVSATRNDRIGVIGTKATIGSGVYEHTIKKFLSKAKILQQATPLLVPLVEEGWLDTRATRMILEEYLKPFRKTGIDTLVLGCTHYPLLKPLIGKILPGVSIIDSAEEMAKETARLIEIKGLATPADKRNKSAFYVTDTPDTFNKVGKMFLKKDMIAAKKVSF